MAGARGHKIGTIYSRMRGILKTEVLPWHKRPVWYDVWEAFPPKLQPEFNRPIPDQTTREIIYPEDFIRAKFYDTYHVREPVGTSYKTETQAFVEAYIKLQTPGATVEEVLLKTEEYLAKRGKFFKRKVPLQKETKE